MIEARFGLKRRPFDKAIDSRKLYLWPGLEELAARLEMVKHSRGILLLTGEPGTGKTVALRRFVDKVYDHNVVLVGIEHFLGFDSVACSVAVESFTMKRANG